ncbi:hypothetical protein PYW07_003385 [Mythimna separata]|uniref:Uncharacterized protein n=1 Tax=Mythimna separata TaxID=271217 RepID=A0AAD7YJL0_MYTSE|nr:hypothetical protein PYW07_003385 [Mythimna separata]
MAAIYSVFISACLLLVLTQVEAQGVQVVNGKIKVTIGTSAGCSDAVAFIGNHLAEAYRLYGNFLDIEFVSWGRTTWIDGVFFCPFNDCWANRLHRCVLNKLKDNQAAQVHYMTCEFTSPFPSQVQGTYLCAQAVGLNLIDVDYCVAHPGDDLDRKAQEAAVAPMRPVAEGGINFVPYIMFDDFPDRATSDEARVRFASMICFALAADPSTGVTSCQI